jgi:membrane protein implicated in regulation of membrane protease activity
VTPGATAIANIGWRYYLVFVCLTVISIVVIYFFYPETKQRSLEEMAAYFGETVLVETDLAHDKTGEKTVVERTEEAKL